MLGAFVGIVFWGAVLQPSASHHQKGSFVPFSRFLASLKAAKYDEFARIPESRVVNESEFEKMKAHLLKQYEDVSVHHSYVEEDGTTFDCVPFHQQPSLKNSTTTVAPPGPVLPPPAPTNADHGQAPGQSPESWAPGHKDSYGNVMSCAEGTVPLRRVTLRDMVRYPTLQSFFQKAPGKGATPQ